jgi:copper oxidase (laccase) domain-containing protein
LQHIEKAKQPMKDDALLSPVQSPLLSSRAGNAIKHGYFTREGGVSDGIYRGLNVGLGSKDARARVEENRARVSGWFGAARKNWQRCIRFIRLTPSSSTPL